MFVLKDILEVDNLDGIGANREHRNFVEDFHGTIHATADPRAKFCGICYASFAMDALPHCGKKSAEKQIFDK